MTTAAAADQLRLLQLQELDTKIAQLTHKRDALPVLKQLEELAAQRADIETALVTSRTAATDLRRELAKAESDVEQVRTRAQRNEARLAAGQGSPKDLEALQHELGSLAKRQSDLEDVQLDVMDRLEQHTAVLAELEAAAEAIDADIAKASAQRDSERQEINAEGSATFAKRTELANTIEPALLALYEKLRQQHGGAGAAALRARRCEGCRLELNAQDLDRFRNAADDEVLRCEECGRILVRTEESGL